ncbi:MAG: Rv0909 family putative TA system antitoxin [Acidimicrobiales bacterium]
MGIMDNVKNAVRGRSGKVADAVDTAVDKVDQRTKGKYRDKLDSGAGKVKETVTKLDPDAEASRTTEGRTAAGETSWGETSTGRSTDRGPVTGTPPPTGPDASSGTGPDPVAPDTTRPQPEPARATSRPGDESRGGTGPLQ